MFQVSKDNAILSIKLKHIYNENVQSKQKLELKIMLVSHVHKMYIFPLDKCRFQSNRCLSTNDLDPRRYELNFLF